MSYRKFKADRIFDGNKFLPEDQVLVVTEEGTIENIVTQAEAGEDLVSIRGILAPGLVNCHCHLELSHMKDLIPPHTGLIEFLVTVVQKRGFAPEIIQEAIMAAEKEMYEGGIVAVGDIGNTSDTAMIKKNSRIYWHNFVEVLSFTDDRSDEMVDHYLEVMKQFGSHANQKSSITAHAPYTISPKTFEAINRLSKEQLISIHNQEHPAEDVLYQTGGGPYLRLFEIFGIHESPFPITGLTSLQSYLPHFNQGQKIILVHNTSTGIEDIRFAKKYASENGIEIVYCLCVNANLYIENKVPPVALLMEETDQIVMGTDSYSSNWQLSMGAEIKSMHEHFPTIPLEKILNWATLNGARALGRDESLGSFEKGKTPGLVEIRSDWTSRRIL